MLNLQKNAQFLFGRAETSGSSGAVILRAIAKMDNVVARAISEDDTELLEVVAVSLFTHESMLSSSFACEKPAARAEALFP